MFLHSIPRAAALLGLALWLTGCAAAQSLPTAGDAVPAEDAALGKASSVTVPRNATMTISFKDGTTSPALSCDALEYAVQTPRDIATGQASGKRQHKPLTLYVEWSAYVALMLQTLVTNDHLTSVRIDFANKAAGGPKAGPDASESMILDQPSVDAVTQVLGNPASLCAADEACPAGTGQPADLMAVSFTPRKVTFTAAGGKSVVDDWTQ